MLRYLTAGESHGPGLVVIVDGLPAGLPVTAEDINKQLARRQTGHGRGGRMQIEADAVQIQSGVRNGVTTGGPVSLLIANRDHGNWREVMRVEPGAAGEPVTRPRPGHADLAGRLKFDLPDLRDVIERASARETAARTAAGALARILLQQLGVEVLGHVVQIGSAVARPASDDDIKHRAESSPVRCADPDASHAMVAAIDQAAARGDSLGGVVEVRGVGILPGLGSYGQHDLRLDGRLAGAVMSIPGIKAVEIGDGWDAASLPGSEVHDEIIGVAPPRRKSNRAGGIEGGVTNGEPVVVRAAMKPIPTLLRPLATVDMVTGEPATAHSERSDTCAVPACCVVVEAAVCWELARASRERLGGDDLTAMLAAHRRYRDQLGL